MLLAATPALAQDSTAVDTSLAMPDTAAIETVEAVSDTVAMVRLGEIELFELRGASVISAQDRADKMSAAILEVAKSRQRKIASLHLLEDDRIKAVLIMCDNLMIGSVWDYEAEGLGTTSSEIAGQRLEAIREAIIEYRQDFSARALIKSTIYAVIITVVLIILLNVIGRLKRRIESVLEDKVADKVFLKILSGTSLVVFTTGTLRLVHFFTMIWLVLLYLNILLSLFPWTVGIASQVFDFAAGPLKTFGQAFLAEIPSLFFLIFIVFATVFMLRGIRFFFHEIERKRITISGFYPDWARPTFNIIRTVVIAFAVVVAFPYIPGSDSGAFKGMSLFLGVLVSLGSSSAMANIVSGIILIYMRPYEIGDRVEIGTTIGDVVDRNLLTTRIRTPKNERVTIPNTNILAGQVINYTSKRRTKELILHTSVTIGYDVPWRTVHELLLAAAADTEGCIADPEPFVLQKGLQDFYVEYELNAYTDKPRSIPATYSVLHQNIQDKFIEGGVEILSPHYRVMRDGGLESGPQA